MRLGGGAAVAGDGEGDRRRGWLAERWLAAVARGSRNRDGDAEVAGGSVQGHARRWRGRAAMAALLSSPPLLCFVCCACFSDFYFLIFCVSVFCCSVLLVYWFSVVLFCWFADCCVLVAALVAGCWFAGCCVLVAVAVSVFWWLLLFCISNQFLFFLFFGSMKGGV